MDFVITEDFIRIITHGAQLPLLKELGLFIGKKASYVLENYEIDFDKEYTSFIHEHIKYVFHYIKKIYEKHNGTDICEIKDDGKVPFKTPLPLPSFVHIILDKDVNILFAKFTIGVGLYCFENVYNNGILIKSVETLNLVMLRKKTVITKLYEYYDDGKIYKITSLTTDTEKMFIDSPDGNVTVITYYDIFGNITREHNIYFDKKWEKIYKIRHTNISYKISSDNLYQTLKIIEDGKHLSTGMIYYERGLVQCIIRKTRNRRTEFSEYLYGTKDFAICYNSEIQYKNDFNSLINENNNMLYSPLTYVNKAFSNNISFIDGKVKSLIIIAGYNVEFDDNENTKSLYTTDYKGDKAHTVLNILDIKG